MYHFMLVDAIPIFLMRSLRSSHARFLVVPFCNEICSDSTVGTVWSGLVREGVKNIPMGWGASPQPLGTTEYTLPQDIFGTFPKYTLLIF